MESPPSASERDNTNSPISVVSAFWKGVKWNVVEWSGAERNEDAIPSFGNFRMEQGKFFIPSKSEEKKYGDFDLEKEKSVLDEQEHQIAENQGNSQKIRRKLAESTRSMHTFPTIFKSWLKYTHEISRKLRVRISQVCLMPCLRGTRKRLIILLKEQSLGRMLFLTYTKSCMKPPILIHLLPQLLCITGVTIKFHITIARILLNKRVQCHMSYLSFLPP